MTNLSFEATSRTAKAGSLQLHFNEAGPTDGETLVFLHGGGPGASSWSNFKQNLPSFADDYRCLLVDMPGFGKSDPVTLKEPRIVFNSHVFKNFLDALGIDKAHFVGNSMGGGTSAKFAIDHPDRVDNLVLMGAAGAGTSIFSPMPMEGIKILQEVFRNPTKEGFRKMIEVFVYDSSFVTEELLEQRLNGTLSHPEHLEANRNSIQAQADLSPDMGKIQAKTLVIHGRDDRFVPLDHSLRYLWNIPNAQLHVFSQCGHWAQYEKSEEFNRLIEQSNQLIDELAWLP